MLCICNISFESCPVCGKQPEITIKLLESNNTYQITIGCSSHLNTGILTFDVNALAFDILSYHWKDSIKEYKKKNADGYSEHRYSRKLTEAGVIERMSDNNPGTVNCLLQLLSNAPFNFHYYVKLLDDLGIYGTIIYKLWNDCCERDFKWFEATLQYFNTKGITADLIHEVLNQDRPAPFIKRSTLEDKEARNSEL